MKGGAMDGMDAMLSTVQMPAGMPVATVALGKAGAINAAYLAMQILAISDKDLAIKLKEDRIVKAKAVESDSKDIEVILLDIKSGGARLSKGQQAIAQAIREGRVRFETVRINFDD